MAESLYVNGEQKSAKGHHEVLNPALKRLEDCGYNMSAHNWLEKNYWLTQYQYHLQTLFTCHFLVNRPGSTPQGGGVDWGRANQTAPASRQQQQQAPHRGAAGGIIGEMGVWSERALGVGTQCNVAPLEFGFLE